MTYQYLSTAPTAPRPLARHLPQAPAPKPTMTMAEMAKQENIRAGLRGSPGYQSPSKAPRDPNSLSARIFRAVRDKGPIKVADLVELTGAKPRQVYNAVRGAKDMAAAQGYDWQMEYVGKYGEKTRSYEVVKA